MASSATSSLGFVLAGLVTAVDVYDAQAAAMLANRAAQDGTYLERMKVEGIDVGPWMARAAQHRSLEMQLTIRERAAEGFRPLLLPLR